MGILPSFSLPFQRKQNWTLVDIVVSDPQSVSPEMAQTVPASVLEKMLLGVTTYIWENQDNSTIRKAEYLGSNETPLKQALDRAAQWGRYDIEYNGKKYAVLSLQETQPPPSSESTQQILDITKLPVR